MLNTGRNWRNWVRALVGCRSEAARRSMPSPVERVDPEELAAALRTERPPVLIDIRSPDAFAGGHLPGAINVPLADLARSARGLDRSAPTVVY